VSEGNDPRVFFAAERTLLAWVRTGLAVMGLGFVVARFGLFLRIARGQPEAPGHLGSTLIGVALVLLGSTTTALAAWQHMRFCRDLAVNERPPHYWIGLALWFSLALAATGAILAIYLLLRTDGS
jgi:putative membrane protein